MKKIAIIGHGYVGQAVERFFKDHFLIEIVDPKYPDLQDHKKEANKCEFAVICVPTPMREDGSVNLDYIRDVFSWLTVKTVLIKSAIPPGTTNLLQKENPDKLISVSPEYIGEGKYEVQWWSHDWAHPTDMKKHSFQIFGGTKEATHAAVQYFKRVVGPGVRYHQSDALTVELCKYMENSWGATKVTFCNEFFDLAKLFGVDYDELRELFLLDGRVERMHTTVFEDKRGFGGKCWPKDVNGIVAAAKAMGYDAGLLRAVLEVNEKIKTNQS